MDILLCYGYTPVLWIYSCVMDILLCYVYTPVLWIYSCAMDILLCYGYTPVLWIYSCVISRKSGSLPLVCAWPSGRPDSLLEWGGRVVDGLVTTHPPPPSSRGVGQVGGGYKSVKGIVGHLKKDNCMYQACVTPDCQKKVFESLLYIAYHI